MYYIYAHRNKINNKYYIGITKFDDLNYRWRYGHGYRNQPKFYKAIKKYGWENFDHITLCTCATEDVDSLEQYFIKKFDSIKNGYNSERGGCIHKILSEETKLKISKHNARYWKGKHLSDETKRKLSIVRTGKHSPKKNKPYPTSKVSEYGRYISKTKENKFRVRIYYLHISKNFKNLEEAIVYRDSLLNKETLYGEG